MLKSPKRRRYLAKASSLIFNNLLLFTLLSCAKMTYVTQQGWGQLKIQWGGTDYKKVLEDPKVSDEIKNKIKKIQEYKSYFYKYFEKEPTSIYSEVTFLDRKAVSHLVISSLFNEIEPHKEWFPFVGEFPYLGFFNEKSAFAYAKGMEKDQYYTYVRPVYAYSSLGNFEDKILSSFFEFQDEDLAELIFHEIFHTIFFVKDNVDLNENLANYFGKEMMYEYLKIGKGKRNNKIQESRKFESLRESIVEQINKYKKLLEEKKPKDKNSSDQILGKFIQTKFIPELLKRCKQLKIKEEDCYITRGDWNNARFAAYMTYEKKVSFIEKLHKKKKFSLKKLFNYLEQKYKEYDVLKPKESFGTWLEQQ